MYVSLSSQTQYRNLIVTSAMSLLSVRIYMLNKLYLLSSKLIMYLRNKSYI